MTINWDRRRYTEQEFRDAWVSSVSIAEVARKLGLTIYGSTHTTLKNAAKELGLASDHMTGQGWSKGKSPKGHGAPLEQLLVENSTHDRTALKKRLLREGILKPECAICGITEWRGQPAPLDLDHINGVNNDNRLENLRILCVMCHRQTETHGSKRLKKPAKTCPSCSGPISFYAQLCAHCRAAQSVPQPRKTLPCPSCSSPMSPSAKLCQACTHAARSAAASNTYPPIPELINLLQASNFTKVARHLGVSDNAVRKHLRRNGINPKNFGQFDTIRQA